MEIPTNRSPFPTVAQLLETDPVPVGGDEGVGGDASIRKADSHILHTQSRHLNFFATIQTGLAYAPSARQHHKSAVIVIRLPLYFMHSPHLRFPVVKLFHISSFIAVNFTAVEFRRKSTFFLDVATPFQRTRGLVGKQFKNRDMASYMILKVSTTRVFIKIWKL